MTWWVSRGKHKICLSKCSSHRKSVCQAQNLIARWKMNNAHCKRKPECLSICGSLQCCFVVKQTKIKVVNKDTILLWRDTDPPSLQGGRKRCRRLQCGERWDEMRERGGKLQTVGNCGTYLPPQQLDSYVWGFPAEFQEQGLTSTLPPPVLQNQTCNLWFPPWPNSQLRENTIRNSFGLQFSEFKW